MNLTVYGAAQQVTGSMHLLDVDGYKILIDCGLDYEKDSHSNNYFPFEPKDIDVVLLTHAHIDHSGNLPTLVRMGYEGQILSTPPTADLTELLLLDSANIFMNRIEKFRRRNKRKHHAPIAEPLYLQKHVMDTMERFVAIGFNKSFKLNGNIELTFIPTGHLLGAAAIVLTITENNQQKSICFTGDIGRANYPLLNDPQPLPQVDYLVSESTYGGRFHSTEKSVQEILIETIDKCCVKEQGRLIIPAFSVGRTQSLVYVLNKIFSQGLLPPVKVFVDSPMATMATAVFKKNYQYLHADTQSFYTSNADVSNLIYIEALSDSKQASNYYEPCIIISSAGMLDGGRIQDHLFYNIQNYYCTILFIGYCAEGTLGHRLLRGDPIVHIRDRELSVYATIKKTDVLSAHGDHNDLVNTIKSQDKNILKRIFLVHGEPNSMDALKQELESLDYPVTIAEKAITYTL